MKLINLQYFMNFKVRGDMSWSVIQCGCEQLKEIDHGMSSG